MLCLPQLLLDPLESLKQRQTYAGEDFLLSYLNILGVSLLSETTQLRLRQSEELMDEVRFTLDMDVQVLGTS